MLPVPKRVAASYSWRGSGKNTKHPDVKQVSVIGKVGSDRWKSMPNAPFVANFEKLKVEYTKKMDSYHKKLSVHLYYHIEKLKWRTCKRGKHDAEPKKRRRTKKAPSVDALNQLGCIKSD